MIIKEHSAKEMLRPYGLLLPRGWSASEPDRVAEIVREIGGPVVIKALIPAGGRGKAGGVRICPTVQEAVRAAEALLGTELLGCRVDLVLVEPAQEIVRETYTGVVANTAAGCFDLIFSPAGGVEVESLAQGEAAIVHRLSVSPFEALPIYRVRGWLEKAGVKGFDLTALAHILVGLHRAAVDLDAVLLEINPLAVLADGRFCLLDCKLDVDDSALYRHPELKSIYLAGLGPDEARAREIGVSFVPLEGEVGLIASGAGLGMASIDMLDAAGLKPANFLDTGGGISPAMLDQALQLVLAPAKVKGALVNLYGGINRMLDAALGIEAACRAMANSKPVVVKIRGNQQEEAWEVLEPIPQVEVVRSIRTEDAAALLKERLG